MRSRTSVVSVVSLLAALVAYVNPAHAVDPAVKCQAVKLKLAGKYTACRLKTDSTALLKGIAADYSVCDSKLANSWAAIEASLENDCVDLGDFDDIQDVIVSCVEVIPPQLYDVTFTIASSSAPMGILQIGVDYNTAGGHFPGAGNAVDCTNLVPGALFADSDDDATKDLTIGSIRLTNYTTPQAFARCTFERTGLLAPSPDDFVVNVQDASDASGAPSVTAAIAVSITPH